MDNGNYSSKQFHDRLREALEYQGITDTKQQVEKVAQGCGVTLRTARKYLQSTTCPIRYALPLSNLADALEVSYGWLGYGTGYGPYGLHVAKAMETMTKWEKNKCVRFFLRLHNNDAKAVRLGDMCAAGQISRHQLFAAM